MRRVVVIGNSGGGKSILARRIASQIACPCVEIDAVLWQPGWRLTPAATYDAEHARLIAGERWIIDGLGRQESIPQRLTRSTDIVLVDMPLWMHFWLAAERQIQWASGQLEHPPAGIAKMPRRKLCSARSGTSIRRGCRKSAGSWRSRRSAASRRLASVSELEQFTLPEPSRSN